MRYTIPLLLAALFASACGAGTPTPAFSGEETNPTEVALAVEATLAARATEEAQAETPEPPATSTSEVEPTTPPTQAAEPEENADLPGEASLEGCRVEPITDLIPLEADPLIPPVQADEWSQGRADAPITLVEYSDFQ